MQPMKSALMKILMLQKVASETASLRQINYSPWLTLNTLPVFFSKQSSATPPKTTAPSSVGLSSDPDTHHIPSDKIATKRGLVFDVRMAMNGFQN